MKIHKNFKGDINQLHKYTRMKNIKNVFQIVELVIKSYSSKKKFTKLDLKKLLKVINNDSKILGNVIKQYALSNKYKNILIMNKFIYYAILIKLLKNNKNYINEEKYKLLFPKYKEKFRNYGSLFFKNNKKLNEKIENINEDTINELLYNCKLA